MLRVLEFESRAGDGQQSLLLIAYLSLSISAHPYVGLDEYVNIKLLKLGEGYLQHYLTDSKNQLSILCPVQLVASSSCLIWCRVLYSVHNKTLVAKSSGVCLF